MPKKKTGQRKKAEKQKKLQKNIRTTAIATRELTDYPCNASIQCGECDRKQKNRAFCYFCSAIQRVPICAQCGKTKCFARTGDCLVKHPGRFTVGLEMVGAVCDFCEAWICHGRKCLAVHACECPLRDADCVECQRDVWSHGGRVYRCSYCAGYICEDDQFEHQASCGQLDTETYKCASCNRLAQLSCLKCKVCFCDEHVKRKGWKYARGQPIPCPRCGTDTCEMLDRTISVRRHKFGRGGGADQDDDDYEGGYDYNPYDGAVEKPYVPYGAVRYDPDDDSDEDDDESDDDDEDDEDGDEEDDDEDEEDKKEAGEVKAVEIGVESLKVE